MAGKRTGKRPGGRPPKDEAGRIEERILDAAAELFLTQGYGATSIEAVAQKIGISKRTFYHRFDDKAELFGAVVHRLISRLRPAEVAPLFEGKTIEEVLRKIARVILHAALSKDALALQRVVIAESGRFPELAAKLEGEGARKEAIRHIAQLLQKETDAGRLRVRDAAFAAEQFLQMVISAPQRRAFGLGTKMTPPELAQWADDAVELFLNGCRS